MLKDTELSSRIRFHNGTNLKLFKLKANKTLVSEKFYAKDLCNDSPYFIMSAKGMAAGIVIAVVVLVGVGIYTNVFQVARPGIESSINYTKDLVSKVQGNDVVSKAEQITSDVKSVTSQIKVQNPLEPKK